MSTGDELAEPNHAGPLPIGVIRDSNRAMLIAACEAEGARVLDLGIARDEASGLENLLNRAIAEGADMLVTSGGVSMGDRDLVKPLLEKRGTIHFGRSVSAWHSFPNTNARLSVVLSVNGGDTAIRILAGVLARLL